MLILPLHFLNSHISESAPNSNDCYRTFYICRFIKHGNRSLLTIVPVCLSLVLGWLSWRWKRRLISSTYQFFSLKIFRGYRIRLLVFMILWSGLLSTMTETPTVASALCWNSCSSCCCQHIMIFIGNRYGWIYFNFPAYLSNSSWRFCIVRFV